MCFYWCRSVWEREVEENWWRKREWTGFISNAIHCSVEATVVQVQVVLFGRGVPLAPVPRWVVWWSPSLTLHCFLWGMNFCSWGWFCVLCCFFCFFFFLHEVRKWKKVPVCIWQTSDCICTSGCIYAFFFSLKPGHLLLQSSFFICALQQSFGLICLSWQRL